MTRKQAPKDWQAPSAIAVAAHRQTSAGPMGGNARQKNKRDRARLKRELRAW